MDGGRISVAGRPPHHFDNTVGMGFDGIVTFEALKVKWLRGIALYLPIVLKTVSFGYRAPLITLEYDERELTLPP